MKCCLLGLVLTLCLMVEIAVGDINYVQCTTTKGNFTIQLFVNSLVSTRFMNLISDKYYRNSSFYRYVNYHFAQFGIKLPHFPFDFCNKQLPNNIASQLSPFEIAFVEVNGCSTEIIIAFNQLTVPNYPIGKLVTGVDLFQKLYSGYSNVYPINEYGINPKDSMELGNDYLYRTFPYVDYIIDCSILPADIDYPIELTPQEYHSAFVKYIKDIQ